MSNEHIVRFVNQNVLDPDDRRALVLEIVAELRDELVPVKGLTTEDACEMLSCSHPFLMTLEREGLLRPFRHGPNFTRWDPRQIARLLSSGHGIEPVQFESAA